MRFLKVGCSYGAPPVVIGEKWTLFVRKLCHPSFTWWIEKRRREELFYNSSFFLNCSNCFKIKSPLFNAASLFFHIATFVLCDTKHKIERRWYPKQTTQSFPLFLQSIFCHNKFLCSNLITNPHQNMFSISASANAVVCSANKVRPRHRHAFFFFLSRWFSSAPRKSSRFYCGRRANNVEDASRFIKFFCDPI